MPGSPVVIVRDSPPVQANPFASAIQVQDKDGKPLTLDISTFFQLQDHQDKQKREEESHQTRQEIAKGFKDLLKNASSALGHMGREE